MIGERSVERKSRREKNVIGILIFLVIVAGGLSGWLAGRDDRILEAARSIDRELSQRLVGDIAHSDVPVGELILEGVNHLEAIKEARDKMADLPQLAEQPLIHDLTDFYTDFLAYAELRRPVRAAQQTLGAVRLALSAISQTAEDRPLPLTELSGYLEAKRKAWEEISLAAWQAQTSNCSFDLLVSLIRVASSAGNAELPPAPLPTPSVSPPSDCKILPNSLYLQLARTSQGNFDQLRAGFLTDQEIGRNLARQIQVLIDQTLVLLETGQPDAAQIAAAQAAADTIETQLAQSLLAVATEDQASTLTARWQVLKGGWQ